MQACAMDEWLGLVENVSRECDWDAGFMFHFMPDEYTLVFQVRKSPLFFTIKQPAVDLQRFTVSYSGYEPGAERDATMRRFGSGPARPAPAVSDELERWLRGSVVRYAAETTLRD